ncbi:MAG: hypothetical protein P8J32_09105 [bacterium]|nr:hypothetical protein [bacterium]
MNKTVEIWEQSGLLDDLNKSDKVKCTGKMEAMSRFLSSPGFKEIRTDDIEVNPYMVMFPIVRRLFGMNKEFDAVNLTKEFVQFCRENQDEPEYSDVQDPELELTFDFCKQYAE